MLTKRLVPFAAAAAIVMSLSACGSGGTATDTSQAPSGAASSATTKALNIAGVYENTSDAFWGTFICGAQAKAKEMGVDLTVSSITTADNAKLSTTLDTALLANPDGVVFNPVDGTPWAAKVKDLMNQGIPVITSSANLDGDLTYVQANQDASEWADDVAAVIKGESGKAVMLKGLADADWQHSRTDKIVEALKTANPDLVWLDDQIDGFDVNKGTQIMSGVITANPDLKLILTASGPESQAAAAAVKQSGVKGIKIIAFDSVPAAVDAMREGIISLIIAQPAYKIGGAMVQTMADYLGSGAATAGQPVKAGSLDPVTMTLGLITPETLDSTEAKDYIYNGNCSA